MSAPADYFDRRSAELGFHFTPEHLAIEKAVDRLVQMAQRMGAVAGPRPERPKLTLIQGGKDA